MMSLQNKTTLANQQFSEKKTGAIVNPQGKHIVSNTDLLEGIYSQNYTERFTYIAGKKRSAIQRSFPYM